MTVTILKGDCREVLRGLPDESVHCVVTKHLEPWQWGYLAGLVDAECHVGIQKEIGPKRRTPAYTIRFELAMTDRTTVKFVNSLLLTAKVVHCAARGRRLPYYRLRLKGREAIALLRAVVPFVQGKRRQIEICLELDSLRQRLSPSRKQPFGAGRRMPPEFMEQAEPLYQEFRSRQLNKKPRAR